MVPVLVRTPASSSRVPASTRELPATVTAAGPERSCVVPPFQIRPWPEGNDTAAPPLVNEPPSEKSPLMVLVSVTPVLIRKAPRTVSGPVPVAV